VKIQLHCSSYRLTIYPHPYSPFETHFSDHRKQMSISQKVSVVSTLNATPTGQTHTRVLLPYSFFETLTIMPDSEALNAPPPVQESARLFLSTADPID
jgi:hypothetical protein